MDREKVIKGLENCIIGFDCPPECPYLDDCNDLTKPMFVELAKDVLAMLKEQPKIVRCKDCKFLSSPPGSIMFCEHIHKFVDAEWFCADGRKKDA